MLETGWETWLPAWKESFLKVQEQEPVPARLHACRQSYYERAIHAMWDENPTAAAWLLMRTWALSISHQNEEQAATTGWQSAIKTLQLDEAQFPTRLHVMDQFLDRVEETIKFLGT